MGQGGGGGGVRARALAEDSGAGSRRGEGGDLHQMWVRGGRGGGASPSADLDACRRPSGGATASGAGIGPPKRGQRSSALARAPAGCTHVLMRPSPAHEGGCGCGPARGHVGVRVRSRRGTARVVLRIRQRGGPGTASCAALLLLRRLLLRRRRSRRRRSAAGRARNLPRIASSKRRLDR